MYGGNLFSLLGISIKKFFVVFTPKIVNLRIFPHDKTVWSACKLDKSAKLWRYSDVTYAFSTEGVKWPRHVSFRKILTRCQVPATDPVPSPWGDFGGLSPHKLKYETLIQWSFVNSYNINQAPVEVFLATVLYRSRGQLVQPVLENRPMALYTLCFADTSRLQNAGVQRPRIHSMRYCRFLLFYSLTSFNANESWKFVRRFFRHCLTSFQASASPDCFVSFAQ